MDNKMLNFLKFLCGMKYPSFVFSPNDLKCKKIFPAYGD